jgi:hypothetical protein
MKRVLIPALAFIILLSLYGIFFGSKKEAGGDREPEFIPVKTHSELFNSRVETAIEAYLKVKDALVEDDTSGARKNARLFLTGLDSIPLEELKKDTLSIYEGAVATLTDIKANIQSMLSQGDITEMRKDFSMATEMMYPSFFSMIHYEGHTIYLQHCPMAFGDDAGASWLSKSREIMNPYLGKNHPEYHASMLHCGEIKDSVTAK